MKMFRVVLAVFVLCAAAWAQNTVTFSGTKVYADSSQTLLPSGTLCAQPVLNGIPVSYSYPGGGQASKQPTCVAVTSGAFSMTLPSVDVTSPQNIGFKIIATDSSGKTVIGQGAPYYGTYNTGYDNVQPYYNSAPVNGSTWCVSGVCNFDQYPPSLAGVAPTSSGPGFNWRGTWSSSATYGVTSGVRDVVYYNGSSYAAVATSHNVTPGTDGGTDWQLMLNSTLFNAAGWNYNSTTQTLQIGNSTSGAGCFALSNSAWTHTITMCAPNSFSSNYNVYAPLANGNLVTDAQLLAGGYGTEKYTTKTGSYSVQDSDRGTVLATNDASNDTYTLPTPASSTFIAGWYVTVKNLSTTNTVILTPASPTTIDGGASLTMPAGTLLRIDSDGTNYHTTFIGTNTVQPGNLVYASPNGSSGMGYFRALVISDLPSITVAKLPFTYSNSSSTEVVTTTGTQTANAVVEIDGSGNHIAGPLLPNSGANLSWVGFTTTVQNSPSCTGSAITVWTITVPANTLPAHGWLSIVARITKSSGSTSTVYALQVDSNSSFASTTSASTGEVILQAQIENNGSQSSNISERVGGSIGSSNLGGSAPSATSYNFASSHTINFSVSCASGGDVFGTTNEHMQIWLIQ